MYRKRNLPKKCEGASHKRTRSGQCNVASCRMASYLCWRVLCSTPARSASRTVGRTERTDRTGRSDRTGRTDRTGLRGGLKRIDSDGNVAPCRIASCFCWCMLGDTLAHCRSVCFATPRFAISCRDQVIRGETQLCLDALCFARPCFAVLCFAMPRFALLCGALGCYTLLFHALLWIALLCCALKCLALTGWLSGCPSCMAASGVPG